MLLDNYEPPMPHVDGEKIAEFIRNVEATPGVTKAEFVVRNTGWHSVIVWGTLLSHQKHSGGFLASLQAQRGIRGMPLLPFKELLTMNATHRRDRTEFQAVAHDVPLPLRGVDTAHML